jgi:hypothetical protein
VKNGTGSERKRPNPWRISSREGACPNFCYQANSDDFRWSMTAKEVRWHVFLMTQKAVMRTASDRHIETLFRINLDAIACYRDHYATFQWQSSDGQHHGDMTLIDQGKLIDPAWVRVVCRSIHLLHDED